MDGQTIRFCAASLALLVFALQAEAVNKCVDKDGRVSYQEAKCPHDAKEQVLALPSRAQTAASARRAGASAAGPVANDPREDEAILQLASVQSGYEGCVAASPDFAARHEAVYSAWRKANAAGLEKYEGSERYRQILENGRKQLRSPNWNMPGVQAKLAQFCDAQFIPALKDRLQR